MDSFTFFSIFDSERILRRIRVIPEKEFLERVLERDFSCICAANRMKAKIILDAPEVKRAGISAFRFMDDIFG